MSLFLPPRAAAVAFCTATYGIIVPGTVYRMDDVPIPLRPAFDSAYPSDFAVLSAIEKRVCELKGISRGSDEIIKSAVPL